MTKGPIEVKVTIKVADKKHPLNYQHRVSEEVLEHLSYAEVKDRLIKAFSNKLDEAFKGTPPRLLVVRNKDV